MKPFVSVILVAGGSGTRMGSSTPKQFLPLKGRTVIEHSLETLNSLPCVGEVIIACDPHFQDLFTKQGNLTFALSGQRRQDSVWNALQYVSKSADLVCIHDAARPLLTEEDALSVIEEAHSCGAAALAVQVKNTIKAVNAEGFVHETLDRSTLREVQTPQVMRPSLLKKGFACAHKNNLTVTDDLALVELTGHRVKLVKGSYSNIKLTTPEDWGVIQALSENETAQV